MSTDRLIRGFTVRMQFAGTVETAVTRLPDGSELRGGTFSDHARILREIQSQRNEVAESPGSNPGDSAPVTVTAEKERA